MALRGDLKDFSLPDVFQLITLSRKTGVLRIRGVADATGSVWFRDGEVFFAQSNWHHEPLGERLVTARKITPHALEKALMIQAAEPEGGRRLGQILVDEGHITEKVLEAFVQEQIQDTIFDLMRWEAGEFDFELLPEVVHEDIGLTVSIENVIMEGSRRLEEWARIRKKVPSMDVVFKMATAPGEGTFEISLKPVEWSLLLLVDGTRSVSELARAAGRTDFEVARILYGLFSAGLLEFAPEDEVERLHAQRTAEPEEPVVESGREVAWHDEALAEPEPGVALDVETEPAPEPEPETSAPESEPEPVPESVPPVVVRREAEQPPPIVTRREPEIPEFLAAPPAGSATTGDVASLDEMMDAVLEMPRSKTEPSAPEHPAIESWDEVERELPAEVADVPDAVEAEPPVPDFEQDLRSLGIGELPEPPAPVEPPELFAPEEVSESLADQTGGSEAPVIEPPPEPETPPEAGPMVQPDGVPEIEPTIEPEPEPEPEPMVEPEPESQVVPEIEIVPEPERVLEAEPESVLEAEPESVLEAEPEFGLESETVGTPTEKADQGLGGLEADLSDLLESLDEPELEEPSAAIVEPEEIAPEEAGADFSSEMSDEIGALTGARKARPQVNVSDIPDKGGSPGLRMDRAVDKNLVLKIIDGLKKL